MSFVCFDVQHSCVFLKTSVCICACLNRGYNEIWVVLAWLCVLEAGRNLRPARGCRDKGWVMLKSRHLLSQVPCLPALPPCWTFGPWSITCSLLPLHTFSSSPFPCFFTSSLTPYHANSTSQSFTYLTKLPFVLQPSGLHCLVTFLDSLYFPACVHVASPP